MALTGMHADPRKSATSESPHPNHHLTEWKWRVRFFRDLRLANRPRLSSNRRPSEVSRTGIRQTDRSAASPRYRSCLALLRWRQLLVRRGLPLERTSAAPFFLCHDQTSLTLDGRRLQGEGAKMETCHCPSYPTSYLELIAPAISSECFSTSLSSSAILVTHDIQNTR